MDYNTPKNNSFLTTTNIILIIILVAIMIFFMIPEASINNFDIERSLEHAKSEIETKLTSKMEILMDSKTSNNIINELDKSKNELIRTLERDIDDLKSEVVLIQSKLQDKHQEQEQESEHKSKSKNMHHSAQHEIESKKIQTPKINVNVNQDSSSNGDSAEVIIFDPIANYDRLKLTDPLVDPRQRSSADEIPTPQVAAQLNFPTQGVLDIYHRVGLLIAINQNNNNNNNSSYNGNGNQNNNRQPSVHRGAIDNGSIPYNGVQIALNNTFPPTPFSSLTTSTASSKSEINPYVTKSKPVKPKRHHRKHKVKAMKEGFGGLFEGHAGSEFETFGNLDDSDNDNDNDNSYYDGEEYNNNSYDNFTEEFGNLRNNIVNTPGILGSDNNILELIGKKITTNWYKYFTSMSVGNKIIKIVVHNKNRRELYDGDVVFIPELNREYSVQLDEMDMIEYNPYYF
ncbi:MAG: hypothetical protein Gaeavirus12_15 [Gaeavirus sp.]|uniref:Uncharacterized protein n=1 Tax=Gaeavirus sp. TaxID=2487767 RepID=A0A3G5A0X3_9VIRU|nr:MAG: hypothetical protein Gaeavirus12_2 [Gaeavirus sp.]AYV80157.1 MAG: hypothetical protein Gaeavirus12_15 [Gaeavirus sp.]